LKLEHVWIHANISVFVHIFQCDVTKMSWACCLRFFPIKKYVYANVVSESKIYSESKMELGKKDHLDFNLRLFSGILPVTSLATCSGGAKVMTIW